MGVDPLMLSQYLQGQIGTSAAGIAAFGQTLPKSSFGGDGGQAALQNAQGLVAASEKNMQSIQEHEAEKKKKEEEDKGNFFTDTALPVAGNIIGGYFGQNLGAGAGSAIGNAAGDLLANRDVTAQNLATDFGKGYVGARLASGRGGEGLTAGGKDVAGQGLKNQASSTAADTSGNTVLDQGGQQLSNSSQYGASSNIPAAQGTASYSAGDIRSGFAGGQSGAGSAPGTYGAVAPSNQATAYYNTAGNADSLRGAFSDPAVLRTANLSTGGFARSRQRQEDEGRPVRSPFYSNYYGY